MGRTSKIKYITLGNATYQQMIQIYQSFIIVSKQDQIMPIVLYC